MSTRAYDLYEVKISRTRILAVITMVSGAKGNGVISWRAEAMAPMSAPMLIVLATKMRMTMNMRTRRV